MDPNRDKTESDGVTDSIGDDIKGEVRVDSNNSENVTANGRTEDLNDDDELNGTIPDAIDLVLNEIEVENIQEDCDQCKGLKLKFDDIVIDKTETERADKTETERADSLGCGDPIFRYKVIDTIFLFWNTTTMGWVYGQMGPALPDLQVIAGVPLQQATWLFTGFAIGYLGGCLFAGLIQERINPRLMLFLYTLGTAITIGMLPWIPIFVVMVIIRVVSGICIGGQDTGLHSMLFAIWAKEGGPFIQMTHCLSALGGILAPLVTQPFVSQGFAEGVAKESGDIGLNSSHNYTAVSVKQSSTGSTISQEIMTNVSSSVGPAAVPKTRIQYAFLITGILVLSAALPFLVAFLSKRRVKKATRQYSNESIDRNKLPKRIKQLIICIIFVNSFIATAYIDLFPSFLVTFIMEQVHWAQQPASTLTSVYFGTYGVGNFIGVFILAYISSTKLITFSYISSCIMILGILLSIIYNQTELIWVTVGLSGITMSSILPTLFTWTQENVTPVTGSLASGLLISGSAGVMVNPLLLGYMMEVFSPMWFIYLSLGETVFCGCLFTTALVLSRVYSSQGKPELATLKRADSPVQEVANVSEEKIKIYPRGTLFGV